MEVQLFSAYYKICIPCSYRCRVCISYLKVYTVWRINKERIKTIADNNNSKIIITEKQRNITYCTDPQKAMLIEVGQ